MRSLIIVAAGLITAIFTPAHAALGGLSGGLISESQTLRATALAARPLYTATTTYYRHDLALPDGGRASEFVDASGQVFAVSWNAPTMPDLSTLLGSYRSSLDKAQLPQAGMGRAPRQINIRDGDCVLVSSGHMRAYQGYAYLASQLPASFDLKDLT